MVIIYNKVHCIVSRNVIYENRFRHFCALWMCGFWVDIYLTHTEQLAD